MYTCDQSHELLWELVFDLLDAEQSQAVRAHLASCAACRAALERVEAEQQILSQATRLEDPIPLFQPPEPELAPTPAAGTPTEQPADPPSIPLPPPAPRRASPRRWLAAAAAVALVVGSLYGLYRLELGQRREAIAAAQARVAEIDQQVAEATRQAQAERAALMARNEHERAEARRQLDAEQARQVEELRRKYLNIALIGPASYQPGAPSQYRVETRDLDGKPAPADVTVRIADRDQGPALTLAGDLPSKGDLLVQLPTALHLPARPTALLEVAARNGAARERIVEEIHVRAPAYATHLALDKPAYRPGEIVFFRSVTLESFTRRPPDAPLDLIYTLTDPQGVLVYRCAGQSRAGGIGGGEWALTADLRDGEYTLQVAEAHGRCAPESRHFLVHRAGAFAGHKAPAGNPCAVDFFPEGGNLVAGVSNRVYFRAWLPAGKSAELTGQVLDHQGRQVAQVQTARDAVRPARDITLGRFVFTPQKDETYTLRITAPAGINLTPALPAVQAAGLALNVPDGVTRADEPIQALLYQNGPERTLLVGAYYHDRLVAQETVVARPGKTEVRLAPAASLGGVLRLTVFEQQRGELRPLAERLVYRVPSQRLVLTAQTDRDGFRAGGRVQMKVKAQTEKGEATPAWLLVSVVNQQAVAASVEPSLPAFFYLTSELRGPADLERADLLLGNEPRAALGLDLFLATQGWRRFSESDSTALATRGGSAKDAAQKPQGQAEPTEILKLTNASQVHAEYTADKARLQQEQAARERQLQQETRQRTATALARLEESTAARQHALQEERTQRTDDESRAALASRSYQERPRAYARLGLGVLVLALLVLGCGALVIGVVRAALGRPANTLYFATAFTALVICVVAFAAFSGQEQQQVVSFPSQRTGPQVVEVPRVEPPAPAIGSKRAPKDTPQKSTSKDKKAEENEEEAKTAGRDRGKGKDRDELHQDTAAMIRSVPAPRLEPQLKAARDEDEALRRLERLKEARAGADEKPPRFEYPSKPEGGDIQGRGTGSYDDRFQQAAGRARSSRDLRSDKADKKPPTTTSTAPPPVAPAGSPVPGYGGPGLPGGAPYELTKGATTATYVQESLQVYPRQFAAGNGELHDTVLWHPFLAAGKDGMAQVPAFALPAGVPVFRVLIYGHSPSGRLGVSSSTLVAPPRAAK